MIGTQTLTRAPPPPRHQWSRRLRVGCVPAGDVRGWWGWHNCCGVCRSCGLHGAWGSQWVFGVPGCGILHGVVRMGRAVCRVCLVCRLCVWSVSCSLHSAFRLVSCTPTCLVCVSFCLCAFVCMLVTRSLSGPWRGGGDGGQGEGIGGGGRGCGLHPKRTHRRFRLPLEPRT